MTFRLTSGNRRIVYWTGPDLPDLRRELTARDFNIEAFKVGDWANQVIWGRGAIFVVEGNKYGNFVRFMANEAIRYSQAGFKIIVITLGKGTAAKVRGIAESKNDTEKISIEIIDLDSNSNIDESRIAQNLSTHDPGPAPNPKLLINPAPSSSIEQLLLSRAFSDFEAITVKSQTPGNAASKVLLVDAVKAGSSGPYRPLPFFVKFGKISEIQREKTQFISNVEGQIPVANRPALSKERSWLDPNNQGILVCSFIDGPEALLTAAYCRNIHRPAHLIFEEALRCWIDNGLKSESTRQNLYESAGVKSVPPIEKIGKDRTDSAKEAFGARLAYRELIEIMKQLPPIDHRRSLIHGDLHSKNVILQGDHPVLIDFADVNRGPASSDAANLEVSLVFHGYEDQETLRKADREHWLSYVKSNFRYEALGNPVGTSPVGYPNQSAQSGLRVIRLHGLSLCVHPRIEYPTMIAFQLLRFSSHDSFVPNDATARNLAYALAEKILLKILEVEGTK